MSELATGLTQLLGDPSRVLTQPQVLERLSKDFYWYSPVLKAQLDDKRGEGTYFCNQCGARVEFRIPPGDHLPRWPGPTAGWR